VEFILDNLPIVFFIVITIAVRILRARIKAGERQKEPPPVFASALEPDDDDDEETAYRPGPDEAALIDYSRTRGASAYAVEKARVLLARAEEPAWLETFSADAGKRLAPEFPQPAVPGPVAGRKQAPVPVRDTRKRPAGFPYKPGNLSPFQEAVIWAEILGKPKGMI
jgi:hypothetical protein